LDGSVKKMGDGGGELAGKKKRCGGLDGDGAFFSERGRVRTWRKKEKKE